jgi:hypothetical protein
MAESGMGKQHAAPDDAQGWPVKGAIICHCSIHHPCRKSRAFCFPNRRRTLASRDGRASKRFPSPRVRCVQRIPIGLARRSAQDDALSRNVGLAPTQPSSFLVSRAIGRIVFPQCTGWFAFSRFFGWPRWARRRGMFITPRRTM